MVDPAVGANLRALRDAAGLSQSELAARMTAMGTDWTASNVSLVEAGKRKLTLTALGDLCRVLSVPAVALLGTQGVADPVAVARLQAMGGTPSSTTGAQPAPVDDEAAEQVAHQRIGQRVLDRVVNAQVWRGDTTPAERRQLVLDVIEDLYGSRDLYQVREQLAWDRVAGSDSLQDHADARAWATSAISTKVWRELDELGHIAPAPF